MGKINVIFDASQYDMFRLCEARFNYRYNLNKSTVFKAKPLDRGTIIHVGQETYYEALKNGVTYDSARTAALSKIREAGVIQSELDHNEIDRIIDVMEEYYDYWRVEDQNLKIIEVEKPFLYLLYEDDDIKIYMSGKIDLVVQSPSGKMVAWDHKSFDRTSELSRMSNQFKNYCYAMQSDELIVNKIGMQKTLKPHEKFKRPPLSFDRLYLEEWKDNVVTVLRDHYLTCVADNKWPMNETSCWKFNRQCDYLDLCDSSGKLAKDFKLANHYVDAEVWDVTKAMQKASEALEEARIKELAGTLSNRER